MNVIVIGCGRVGTRLATALALRGDRVTVVDPDPAALDRLGPGFRADGPAAGPAEPGSATPRGWRVTGDGCDRGILDRAGIDHADGLAAVTGSDEVNAVLARLAVTRLNVPRVVARIYAPAKAEIYRRLGVQTISPVTWGVERLTELLTFSELTPVASLGTGQVEIVDATVPALLDGRPAAELTVPGETHIVAITRHGATLLASGPSTPLQAGDIVHIAATGTARLSELLGHH
jgi:trk system potassium uptake protein TrkA